MQLLAMQQPAQQAPVPITVAPGAPEPGKPRGRRLYSVLILCLLGVAGLAYWYVRGPAGGLPQSPLAGVRTVRAWSGTLERTIRLTGAAAPARSALLRAPGLGGQRGGGGGIADFGLVLEERVAPGTQVKRGDIVAAFDRLQMRNRLDDYRATRIGREANVKGLLAQLEITRAAHRQSIEKARARMDKAALDLKTAPVRSAIQTELFRLAFEEAELTYQSLVSETRYVEIAAQSQIRLAQIDVQEAVIEERRAEANVERMVIRAAVDGTVIVGDIMRGSELGQIQAGDQLRPGQFYMQIADARSMIIEAKASQGDITRLRIGARAQVRFDAFSDLALPAHLYSISPLATSSGQRPFYVREVPIRLKIERNDMRVLPGLTASADVVLEHEQGAAIIPLEAVFRDAEDGQPYAYVQAESGWERRDLELGLANDVAVTVRSGIAEGEAVATGRPAQVERSVAGS